MQQRRLTWACIGAQNTLYTGRLHSRFCARISRHIGGTVTVRAQRSFHHLRSVSRAAAGMAPGTAAQASAGSRVNDGNAHRALPIRTHGAPPQERQIARSVTRARALLAASSARSHPTCRHHSDTADVTHMSST